jgi:hypothetical protein
MITPRCLSTTTAVDGHEVFAEELAEVERIKG